MGLKDYTDTKNGPQLAVLKHAVIGDRIGEVKIEKGDQCKVGILLGKVYDRSSDYLQEVHA